MQKASTGQRLQVPSLRERDAWGERASGELVGVAVARAMVACGIAGDKREQSEAIAHLSGLVASRGYSPAELAYALQELPYDQEIDWKKKQGQMLTAADFERHVAALRRLRQSLTMKLRTIDVNKLVQEFPALVSVDDFEVTGFSVDNDPLYRYRFTGKARRLEITPVLPEKTVTERESGGTFTLAELIKNEAA